MLSPFNLAYDELWQGPTPTPYRKTNVNVLVEAVVAIASDEKVEWVEQHFVHRIG